MSYFGVVSGTGEWSKSYVIPSIFLTVACVVLLVWHFIDPARQIDAWTVTLLVVGFIPWLRSVFDSIAFPGGGEIKYRQLRAEVETLKFLASYFLSDEQRRVLRKLANSDPIIVDPATTAWTTFDEACVALAAGGYIERTDEHGQRITELFKSGEGFNGWYRVTERGREYESILKSLGK